MSYRAVKFAEKNKITPGNLGFSNTLFRRLLKITAASAVGAIAANKVASLKPAKAALSTLFLLSSTLTSFVYGSRLPKSLTKVVHPLVTCTGLTWVAATGLGAATGSSFHGVLGLYRTGSMCTPGAGDLLIYLLGPAVVSLAMSMYGRRKLMRDNLAEVGTGVGVSTFGGIFGTALAVRMLEIGSPSLRLSLLSRNITSPLAMAIASILGADVSLAVSIVVVTGLLGANFGASILDAFGIKDPVARGLGMGSAAHGLGTAAFANEKDAFPFAAIAMALAASAATVAVSIPFLRKIILQLALGW
jgi:putative effector of murein hydrolase